MTWTTILITVIITVWWVVYTGIGNWPIRCNLDTWGNAIRTCCIIIFLFFHLLWIILPMLHHALGLQETTNSNGAPIPDPWKLICLWYDYSSEGFCKPCLIKGQHSFRIPSTIFTRLCSSVGLAQSFDDGWIPGSVGMVEAPQIIGLPWIQILHRRF